MPSVSTCTDTCQKKDKKPTRKGKRILLNDDNQKKNKFTRNHKKDAKDLKDSKDTKKQNDRKPRKETRRERKERKDRKDSKDSKDEDNQNSESIAKSISNAFAKFLNSDSSNKMAHSYLSEKKTENFAEFVRAPNYPRLAVLKPFNLTPLATVQYYFINALNIELKQKSIIFHHFINYPWSIFIDASKASTNSTYPKSLPCREALVYINSVYDFKSFLEANLDIENIILPDISSLPIVFHTSITVPAVYTWHSTFFDFFHLLKTYPEIKYDTFLEDLPKSNKISKSCFLYRLNLPEYTPQEIVSLLPSPSFITPPSYYSNLILELLSEEIPWNSILVSFTDVQSFFMANYLNLYSNNSKLDLIKFFYNYPWQLFVESKLPSKSNSIAIEQDISTKDNNKSSSLNDYSHINSFYVPFSHVLSFENDFKNFHSTFQPPLSYPFASLYSQLHKFEINTSTNDIFKPVIQSLSLEKVRENRNIFGLNKLNLNSTFNSIQDLTTLSDSLLNSKEIPSNHELVLKDSILVFIEAHQDQAYLKNVKPHWNSVSAFYNSMENLTLQMANGTCKMKMLHDSCIPMTHSSPTLLKNSKLENSTSNTKGDAFINNNNNSNKSTEGFQSNLNFRITTSLPPVYIAFDFEAFERNTNLILEVGISVYDPLTLYSQPWRNFGYSTLNIPKTQHKRNSSTTYPLNQSSSFSPSLFKKPGPKDDEKESIRQNAIASLFHYRSWNTILSNILSSHLIVNSRLRNGRFVPDNKEHFLFGDSRVLSDVKCAAEFDRIMRTYKAVGREIVYVGHGIVNDFIYASKVGIKCANEKFPMKIIDTQNLIQYFLYNSKAKISLGNVLNALEIDHSYLHNAGNDSHYTMALFMAMMDTGMPIELESNQIYTPFDFVGRKEKRPLIKDSLLKIFLQENLEGYIPKCIQKPLFNELIKTQSKVHFKTQLHDTGIDNNVFLNKLYDGDFIMEDYSETEGGSISAESSSGNEDALAGPSSTDEFISGIQKLKKSRKKKRSKETIEKKTNSVDKSMDNKENRLSGSILTEESANNINKSRVWENKKKNSFNSKSGKKFINDENNSAKINDILPKSQPTA